MEPRATSSEPLHTIPLARSLVYQALSAVLDYPVSGTLEHIQNCLAGVGDLLSDHESVDQAVKASVAAANALDEDRLEQEYISIFTHVSAADCNPCETSYLCQHLFQVSQKMANLAGLYKSFGVEPHQQRYDHISVELEFMAFLAYRESAEIAKGPRSQAQEFRKVQRFFLERHLARWVPSFSFFLKQKASDGMYAIWARLLDEVIKFDKQHFDVDVGEPATLGPIPMPMLAEEDSTQFSLPTEQTNLFHLRVKQ